MTCDITHCRDASLRCFLQAQSVVTGMPPYQLHLLPTVLAVVPPVHANQGPPGARNSRRVVLLTTSLVLGTALAALLILVGLRWRHRRSPQPRKRCLSAHGEHCAGSKQARTAHALVCTTIPHLDTASVPQIRCALSIQAAQHRPEHA